MMEAVRVPGGWMARWPCRGCRRGFWHTNPCRTAEQAVDAARTALCRLRRLEASGLYLCFPCRRGAETLSTESAR